MRREGSRPTALVRPEEAEQRTAAVPNLQETSEISEFSGGAAENVSSHCGKGVKENIPGLSHLGHPTFAKPARYNINGLNISPATEVRRQFLKHHTFT